MKIELDSYTDFDVQIEQIVLDNNGHPDYNCIIYSQELIEQYTGRLSFPNFKLLRIYQPNNTTMVALENKYKGDIEDKLKTEGSHNFKVMCIPNVKEPIVIMRVKLEIELVNTRMGHTLTERLYANEVAVWAKIDKDILVYPSTREIIAFCK